MSESVADLAAAVREMMRKQTPHNWSHEREQIHDAALDALVARCEQAERERDEAYKARADAEDDA